MHLGGTPRLPALPWPLPLGNGWANPSPAQLPTERLGIVPLVCGQSPRPLLRAASGARHSHPVHHLQSHPLLMHLSAGDQDRQWGACAVG